VYSTFSESILFTALFLDAYCVQPFSSGCMLCTEVFFRIHVVYSTFLLDTRCVQHFSYGFMLCTALFFGCI
jgi:hypothetical protein